LAREPERDQIAEAFARARPALLRQREAAEKAAPAALRAMRREVEKRHESLAHHLLELPLLKVLYFWLILRLKLKPWRVLVPASIMIALLFRLIGGAVVPNLWRILAGGMTP
jgi:hypothetical protein